MANKELDFILKANKKMAKLLDLQSADVIEQRVEHPIIAMKILFSIYRRVRTLAEYRNSGKARLPQSAQIDENGDLP